MNSNNTQQGNTRAMPDRFDPFTHRLSRDVRNTLSTALEKSLASETSEIFETAAAEWLDRLSHDPCRRYVEERRRRYRQAFDAVGQLSSDRLVLQIAILWNLKLYFEVHEVAEEVWHAATGDYRKFLQGLILAAGVFVQQDSGRHKAAGSLSKRAYGILDQYRDRLAFMDNPESFLNGLLQDPPQPVPMDLT